jgi:hypothetical protein
MKKLLSIVLSLILILSFNVSTFASSVDYAVVDVSTPTDSVILAEGGTSTISIIITVTGRQEGTATFEVYKDWTLINGIFVGSNKEAFKIDPRAAGTDAIIYNLTGVLKVTSVPDEGTYTLSAKAENITNSNTTGAKLGEGKSSDYDVVVDNPAPPVDTTKPIITLNGDEIVTVEAKTAYTDLGATANDNYDGDITANIKTTSDVDANVKGTYHVTYNVSDAAGNAAVQVTRTVNVVDTTKPKITLNGDTTVKVKIGSTYIDLGATANDNYDGDITANIITISTVDTSKIGEYKVTYDVKDASGNVAIQVVRTVNVVYDFKGFFQPVDMGGVLNTVKAGSAIPIKFSLGGNMGLQVFAQGYPKINVYVVKDGTIIDAIETTLTAGNSSLSYDSVTGQYTYVWKTLKEWAGYGKQLVVKFNDGTEGIANFSFFK